jgi:FKBP-type peptidyl-prolyl cis-trans isomerase
MKEQQKYYDPFPSTYSMNEQLIQGFKEGLQEMEFGDKAVLFIPYHLGYGEQGMSGIPPKSDLIFELELFPPN